MASFLFQPHCSSLIPASFQPHFVPASLCQNVQLYNNMISLIARSMGPIWGPSGAARTQVGPMLAPWTLLSGLVHSITQSVLFTRHQICLDRNSDIQTLQRYINLAYDATNLKFFLTFPLILHSTTALTIARAFLTHNQRHKVNVIHFTIEIGYIWMICFHRPVAIHQAIRHTFNIKNVERI